MFDASPTPCRCAQPDRRLLLGGQRLGHQHVVVDRHRHQPQPAQQRAGTRWCRAPPGGRAPRPPAVRTCMAPAWSSSAGGRRCPRRPARPRRAPPAAAPRPAGPAPPGRCRRGSHSPARYVGESTSARTCARVQQPYVVPGRPPAARPGRRAPRPRAGADATVSSPVSSQRAVDAVAVRTVSAMPRRFSAPSRSSSASSSGQRSSAVAEPVGQAGRREPAVAAAGLVAAVPGLEQHHVGRRVPLLGPQRRPQPGVAAADHDQVGRLRARAATASASGRAGSSSQ